MTYLAITSLLWAFSFGLIGSAVKGLDALQVADARLLFALLVFAPFLKLHRTNGREKLQLIAIGAVQYGLMYTCYMSAYRFLPSHLVALFTILTPLYIVLIYDLRQRRFTPWYLLAALLSVAGAAAIKGQSFEQQDIWLGFVLMQIANLGFAYGQVTYRDWKLSRPQLADRDSFAFLYLGAVIFVTSILLVTQRAPFPLNASMTQWLVMGYLGLVATGVGFFLWNKGAALTNAGALAAFNNAVVPLAMFASLFIFGEARDTSAESLFRLGAGSLLILFAVAVSKGIRRES